MDEFGKYIQELLPAVLKRKKQTNQLLVFCKILGFMFDDIKTALFRLREESILEACSDCMLEVFGQDYDMQQMKGETHLQYRKRLQMKAQVAERAGTLQGILYALEAVGYDNCSIEPLWETDPERWAEININFITASVDDDNTIDFRCIVEEVMKVKQASTLPHYVFHYPAVIKNSEKLENLKVTNRYTSNFYSGVLYLDGSWLFDGTQILNGGVELLPTHQKNRYVFQNEESVSARMCIYENLWVLDGSVLLDGSRVINAYKKEIILDE